MKFDLNFFNSNKTVLGLDIGTSAIKLVELQKTSSGIKLVNCAIHEFDFDPEDKSEDHSNRIILSLQNILAENNITPSQVVIAVPGQSVFTRYVKLPAVEESKINQIISYEAQQQVPFPIDEVVWDYQIIGDRANPELNVVLVAIKADIISQLIETVSVAKLDTDIVDVAPLAIGNAIIFSEKKTDKIECTGVLDIGAKTTNFIIIEGENEWTRSIPIAGHMITKELQKELKVTYVEAEKIKRTEGLVLTGDEKGLTEHQKKIGACVEKVLKRLYAEISRSIGFYRIQSGGSALKRLIFSGGTSQLTNIREYFVKKLNIRTEMVEPFSQLEIDSYLGLEELASLKHLFAEAIGLALRKVHECAIHVNLIPRKIARQRQINKRKGYILLSAIMIYVMMATVAIYSRGIVITTNAKIKQYDFLIGEMRGFKYEINQQEKNIKGYKNELDLYAKLMDERVYWLDLLLELEKITPENVWISKLMPKSSYKNSKILTPSLPRRSARGRKTTGSVDSLARDGKEILLLVANTTGVYDDVYKYFGMLKDSVYFVDDSDTKIDKAEKPVLGIRKFYLELKLKKEIPK